MTALDTPTVPRNWPDAQAKAASEIATFTLTMIESIGMAWAAIHQIAGTGRLLPWEKLEAAIEIAAVFADVETSAFGAFGTLLALGLLDDVENYGIWAA